MNELLLIGGFDPSGGAGLLRDAWTIDEVAPELGVIAIATALTRQGHGGPAQAFPVTPEALRRELERVHEVAAIKLGMVASTQISVLVDALDRLRASGAKVVLDPITHASDGGPIGARPAELLELAGHVDLLTPNRDELAQLRACGPIRCAVLGKAEVVPAPDDPICDRLSWPGSGGRERMFARPRVPGPDPRGTGCALASAIACELARGRELEQACETAIAWLDGARQRLVRGRDGCWQLARA